MDSKPYLIFSLDNAQYGIEANLVKEIFALPELTTLPESPTDIIGILDLRGEVVPIMHLALRLGDSHRLCQVSDQIIVLDWAGLQIGLVVDQVREMSVIESEDIQALLDYGRVKSVNPAFIAGIAKIESELVMLLNPETLIRQPEQVAAMIWGGGSQFTMTPDILIDAEVMDFIDQEEISSSSQIEKSTFGLPRFGSFCDRYCPQISVADRAILQRRAEALRLPMESLTDSAGLLPIAIVNLGGESFGLELTVVKEFTSIRNLTHIPCCPQHIVGNMNLRGEIVTLVDIRHVLNLPAKPVKVGSQTVVVQVEDILAGLPVDGVSDVLYINPAEIKPVPIALQTSDAVYLQSTVLVRDLTLGILDLRKIMMQGGLEVNDG